MKLNLSFIVNMFLQLSSTFFVYQLCAQEQLKLPSIFGHHMVLQRDHVNPVWGWGEPGETIQVQINNQQHMATAGEDGSWKVFLQPMNAGGPHELTIAGEKSQFQFSDVMIGEVWICSGQSNMAWPIRLSDHAELEIATANHPQIRLISVPQVGVQEPQLDFEGSWSVCSPEAIRNFSAVGYFFGRRLQDALGVPIGLIDNAWGGSAAEAWINRGDLADDGRFNGLLEWWKEQEMTYDHDNLVAQWNEEMQQWEDAGRIGNPPRKPGNMMTGNKRPGNIYNGVLHPTIGFGIKGVIWYQGESNAGRAHQYRSLFPMMIDHWRNQWQQGDFPFYYVQLADFLPENSQPEESAWAELREAQTMAMTALTNVGQAVIIDVGEGRDIHPRDKQTVANRLALWALARDYGLDIHYRSPEFQTIHTTDTSIIVTFNFVGSQLYSFDQRDPLGFTIAGDDQNFVNANARIITNNQIEVWHKDVSNPKAVRYAWANNPKCNVYSREGLPLTPFRSDNWDGITKGVEHP